MNLLYEIDGKIFSDKKDAIKYEDDLVLKTAKYKPGDIVYVDISEGYEANIEKVTIIKAYVTRWNKRGGGWKCRIGYQVKTSRHNYPDSHMEDRIYGSLEEFAMAALKKKKSNCH